MMSVEDLLECFEPGSRGAQRLAAWRAEIDAAIEAVTRLP